MQACRHACTQNAAANAILSPMTFATRLQILMRHRGIRSQSQLARLSGVSQASIHRILRSAHRGAPSVKVLMQLSRVLDTSPAWLMHAEFTASRGQDLHDPDEREWCALYRRLQVHERQAVLALARTLGNQPGQ